jgi:hypothetical protein
VSVSVFVWYLGSPFISFLGVTFVKYLKCIDSLYRVLLVTVCSSCVTALVWDHGPDCQFVVRWHCFFFVLVVSFLLECILDYRQSYASGFGRIWYSCVHVSLLASNHVLLVVCSFSEFLLVACSLLSSLVCGKPHNSPAEMLDFVCLFLLYNLSMCFWLHLVYLNMVYLTLSFF